MPATPASTAPSSPAPSSPTGAGPTAAPSSSTATAQPSSSPTAPASEGKTITQSERFNDAFSEIDKIIADTQQKTPKPPGARRAEKNAGQPDTEGDPSKAAADKTAIDTAKDADKDKSKDKDKSAADVDETKLNAPELRSAYQQRKRELHEAKEKLTAAETRLKELESKQPDAAELTKLQERLANYEKENEKLKTEIKYVDYEKSPEYDEKYRQPFVRSYQTAHEKVGTLKIRELKNDVDEVVQQARKATPDDFDAIMRIQDDADAAEVADRMFGPMANLVMYHREKVLDLHRQSRDAIDDYRKKGSEREQQMATQSKAVKERLTQVFNESKRIGIEKHPQWFKPDDGDEQGKKLLEKGMLDADRCFSDEKIDPVERAARHAALRNKAAGFDYLALRLHRSEARIAELEDELKSYKASEPSEPSRDRGEPAKGKTWEQELDELATLGR